MLLIFQVKNRRKKVHEYDNIIFVCMSHTHLEKLNLKKKKIKFNQNNRVPTSCILYTKRHNIILYEKEKQII